MSNAQLKPSIITLSDAFSPLIVRGNGIEVEFRDGEIHVRSGKIASTPTQQALSTSTSPAALKVGDVVAEGPNKGWIYCETKAGEAFLVAPKDNCMMQWRAAMDYAAREKVELPSKEQLNAMYEARNTGALKGTFNVSGGLAGWYWSALQNGSSDPWCLGFSAGNWGLGNELSRSSLRCIRRCSII